MSWVAIISIGAVLVMIFALKRLSFAPVDLAKEHLARGALVIDVRSPEEFRGDHVRDAINIPLGELRASLPLHVKDKQRTLLVHCLSGGRSAIARQRLKALGYQNVFNLGSLARAKAIVNSRQSD